MIRPAMALMAGAWLLSACVSADGRLAPETAVTAAPAPAPLAAGFAALLTHPERQPGDAESDASRKPDLVLAFAGVEPGMRVLELEAGSGYYTELLARAVGPEGSVVMQNPPAFDGFLGDSVEERLAGGRLGPVEPLRTNFDALGLPDASVDMVTWILGPHELWFEPNGENLGDPEGAFAEIVRVLKPGGVFVALDHAAPAGAPPSTGGETHRIDPAIVLAMAEAAGLDLAATADFLANPDDPRTAGVFEESIRRKTDRFVMKFVKPAE